MQVQEGPFRTFKAGANLSGSQFCFVKLNSDVEEVVVATAATDEIVGILDNAPVENDTARVLLCNAQGTMYVLSSTGISAGARLTATTGGKAVTTTSAGNTVAAIALKTVNGGDELVEVMPVRFYYKA
jgi:hypothetical protein